MKTLLLLVSFFLLISLENFGQEIQKKEVSDPRIKKYLADSAQFEKVRDIGDSLIDISRYTEAAGAVKQMFQIAEQSKSKILMGRAYQFRGSLYRRQNNQNQALADFQKALAEFTSGGSVKRQIRVLQMIEGMYLDVQELDLAEFYCKKALDIIEKNKLLVEKSYIFTDLATIEDIRKNYKKALEYNSEAMRITRETGGDLITVLFNRCIILKNAGQYEKSVESYMECLELARKQKDGEAEGYIYVNLPNTLLKLNRVAEAETYILKGLKWAHTRPKNMNMEVSIYETLTMVNEKKGDYKQALAYQKTWYAYRDSIFNNEKSQQLIETETKFQTREKQQKILNLNKDNLTKKKQLFWLTSGISLLVLLLGVALWQYRKIRSTNRKLSDANGTLHNANLKISIQSAQLKELMQELHHRVKNNLAIISSLLYLQANRLDDKKAVQAVLDGQQRVEAMSLIHQQLYQTDNVTQVGMKEYIGDLVGGLTQSFQYKDNLKLALEVEDISVDVELAVPLGLIINELVTNVFKHAFKEVEWPELSISLWQNEHLYLEVKDNGPGINPDQWKKAGQTFGKRLVISLTKQLNGNMEVSPENGSKFLLTMPPVHKGRPEFSLAGS